METRMTDLRRRQLAIIHLARRQLFGDDEDSYRNFLWATCRVRSAADLDEPGRRHLIENLESLGFKSKRAHRPTPGEDRLALVRKIRALLASMNLPDQYGDGMSKKMFGVERYEWCNPDQLHRLVAALTYHQRRHGRRA